jgi:hypothetical protein
MWTYSQSTGRLTTPAGDLAGFGYSGRGTSLNSPDSQDLTDVGPCPQGLWTIGEFFDDPGGKGPLVCHLTPQAETETFGRTGLMIHGDNSEANHTASEGCIILAHPLRQLIQASSDRLLEVVA